MIAIAARLLGVRATRMVLAALLRTRATGTIETQGLGRLESFNVDDRNILLEQFADIAQQAFLGATDQRDGESFGASAAGAPISSVMAAAMSA